MTRAALKMPLQAAYTTPATHLDHLKLLTESINAAVQNLCKMIFDYFRQSNEDADAKLHHVHAQVLAAVGFGVLSI